MQLKRSHTHCRFLTVGQMPLLAAALFAASLTILPAHAQSLGSASSYNLYVTNGNARIFGSDSEGGIAANGSIDGTNYYSVNSKLSSSVALAAAGNITGSFTSYGDAYAEGTITSTMSYPTKSTGGNGTGHAGVAASSMPLNFSATNSYLTQANAAIYSRVGTSVSYAPTISGTSLTFTATTSGANYFQIDGTTLHNATSISFVQNGNANVSFLVNVTSVDTTVNATTNPFNNAVFNGNAGTQVNGQQNLQGINQVLYNLNPSIVGFSANGIQGSVLAPNAAFNGEGSATQVDGNMIVQSYNQNSSAVGIEFHTQYNGNADFYTGFLPTPATPAEESMLLGLTIGALRGIWSVRKRRKGSVAKATA